jgi:predicted TPR repeat methyltransferase
MSDSAIFEQARNFFLSGNTHYQAGRFEQAERDFEASLALLPGRPSTLTNLGAARLKLGRADHALQVLDEALQQEPGNAETLSLRATALAELGLKHEALAAFDRVVAVDPKSAQAWSLRGSVLNELGRREEAARSYEQAVALGADPELHRYYLAALQRDSVPSGAPRQYVEGLFDSYADGFDAQLVSALKYQAPQVLARGLADLQRRFDAALDLGCGTGLCGPLVQPYCARIDGVDLSAGMLEKARALGVYAQLAHADIHDFLASANARYDLVLAADVFIYVGALEHVFGQVARVMPAGGVFCFSLEEASEAERLVLRASRRYAHSEGYIRALAAQHGFAVTSLQRGPVREEERVAIPGLYFWLARSA